MMTSRIAELRFCLAALLLAVLFGCGGGGADSGPPAVNNTNPVPVVNPAIQVTPSSYNFGIVTPGNTPAPLEVEISNSGSGVLNVTSLVLSDPDDFSFDFSAGASPCGAAGISLAPAARCTLAIDFVPQRDVTYAETLTILSNATNSPELVLPLAGALEPVATNALNLRINQINACSWPTITSFVSVTDQANYPYVNLTAADFTLTEGGVVVGAPGSAVFVKSISSLAVTLVMDYSGSIFQVQDSLDDLQESAVSFVDQLGVGDEAEVIKFADNITVVQPFTADKALLQESINTPYNNGSSTNLNGAIYKALEDTGVRTKERRAVIVLTDGEDTSGMYTDTQIVERARALDVPIFTIGWPGQFGVDSATLKFFADETGGQYYESPTTDNLRTIYGQLSKLLFSDQYILTYSSQLAAGTTADLTVEAIGGSDTRAIPVCP